MDIQTHHDFDFSHNATILFNAQHDVALAEQTLQEREAQLHRCVRSTASDILNTITNGTLLVSCYKTSLIIAPQLLNSIQMFRTSYKIVISENMKYDTDTKKNAHINNQMYQVCREILSVILLNHFDKELQCNSSFDIISMLSKSETEIFKNDNYINIRKGCENVRIVRTPKESNLQVKYLPSVVLTNRPYQIKFDYIQRPIITISASMNEVSLGKRTYL